MKTYKCVKSWKRHGIGTSINEWEYTKLPINIKTNHFQEITLANIAPLPSTTNTPIAVPQSTVWMGGSKPIDLNVQLTDTDKVTVTTTTSSELTVASSPTDLQITTSAPLTTFSSGNKFKDKLHPKVENNIRPTE